MKFLYKLISIILIPIAFIYGLFLVSTISAIFTNPSIMLSFFIVFCYVAYVFTSTRFLNRVIIQQKSVSLTLRSWIKANGGVNLIFSFLMLLMSFVYLKSEKSTLYDAQYKLIIDNMKNYSASYSFTVPQLKAMMHSVFVGIIFFSILLIIHVLLSFRFLKDYENYFIDTKNADQ